MVLRAGLRLGVFDAVTEPRSGAELASSLEIDARSLGRLLAALETLGLLEREEAGFVATSLGETLASDHPSHVRDLVLMQSEGVNLLAWADLDEAVRTGHGVFERAVGASYWDHLHAHPDLERTFNAAMARRAAAQVRVLVSEVVLGAGDHVVDVGGGRGGMLAGLLEAVPGLTGIVADRPSVADEATAHLADLGYGDRARGVGCDFLASVPSGGDVYSIANVLHDWDDESCLAILRSVRAAMTPQSRVLVVERVLDAPGRTEEEHRELQLLDLHMLVMFGGQERTHDEYDALLAAAGFTASRLAGEGDWHVLEARPAGPDPAPE